MSGMKEELFDILIDRITDQHKELIEVTKHLSSPQRATICHIKSEMLADCLFVSISTESGQDAAICLAGASVIKRMEDLREQLEINQKRHAEVAAADALAKAARHES